MGALQVVVPQHAELEEPPGCSWEEMGTPREVPRQHPGCEGHLCAWPLCCKGRGAAAGGGEHVSTGISERCHFSLVFCHGLLTSAHWVTGVNPSRGEG